MSLQRTELADRGAGPRGLTRRKFLQMVGATTGGAAVMNVMTAWGRFPSPRRPRRPRSMATATAPR